MRFVSSKMRTLAQHNHNPDFKFYSSRYYYGKYRSLQNPTCSPKPVSVLTWLLFEIKGVFRAAGELLGSHTTLIARRVLLRPKEKTNLDLTAQKTLQQCESQEIQIQEFWLSLQSFSTQVRTALIR